MKTYLGTKIVNAMPATRAEYLSLREWDLPADENGADEGYLVEYTDGGKPNMPELFAGYITWSPKDVFDRAYKEIGDFRERVRDEKAQLDDKIVKLAAFVNTSACLTLPFEDRSLLAAQLAVMQEYTEILTKRIGRFA